MSDPKPLLKDFFDKARGERSALPAEEIETLVKQQQHTSAVRRTTLLQLFHTYTPMKMAATFAFAALIAGGAYYYTNMSRKVMEGQSIGYANKESIPAPQSKVESPDSNNAGTSQAMDKTEISSQDHSRERMRMKKNARYFTHATASAKERQRSLLCLDVGKMLPHIELAGSVPIDQDFLYPRKAQFIEVDTMSIQ